MKFFIVLLAAVSAALAAPQFGFGGHPGQFGGGFGGSASNAAAGSQSFK